MVLYSNVISAASADTWMEFPSNTAVEFWSINNGVQLKITPLGASIVWGQDSSDGNGFRLHLRDLLERGGNNVSYVGTVFHGNMSDNACEAFPGRTIDEVDQDALQSGSYDFVPNVILVHLGTNDCMAVANETVAIAAQRSGSLLSTIQQRDADALVMASTLIHNLVPSVEDCIKAFNAHLPAIIQQARMAGQKVVLVDMHDAVPTSDINTTDATHPTDAGYAIMAQVWYDGIVNASTSISAPNTTGKEVPATPSSAVGLGHMDAGLGLHAKVT
ncbi:hypothetical protein B0A55_01733 [Friedmanniomyces simplex]|uniref:SGNH hydrolase-type esterase domain-containing protein n=1 Tax=Friedmanniomyces simplex TaxID=329884 RepID=A0A4U0XVU0_9PEZI|nr:hypothetical protein B0A55_01733 [Friedmanniomyces simplex]